MKTKKKNGLYFLAIIFSVFSVFSLLCVNENNFKGLNSNKVYAESQNIVYDNFDLESSSQNEISSDHDTGWKTFDGRNAPLFFSGGTAVSEAGIFFELGSNARNSYYPMFHWWKMKNTTLV